MSECLVCLQLVTANLQCPLCQQIYCGECLRGWLSQAPLSAACPAVRGVLLFAPAPTYKHSLIALKYFSL